MVCNGELGYGIGTQIGYGAKCIYVEQYSRLSTHKPALFLGPYHHNLHYITASPQLSLLPESVLYVKVIYIRVLNFMVCCKYTLYLRSICHTLYDYVEHCKCSVMRYHGSLDQVKCVEFLWFYPIKYFPMFESRCRQIRAIPILLCSALQQCSVVHYSALQRAILRGVAQAERILGVT